MSEDVQVIINNVVYNVQFPNQGSIVVVNSPSPNIGILTMGQQGPPGAPADFNDGGVLVTDTVLSWSSNNSFLVNAPITITLPDPSTRPLYHLGFRFKNIMTPSNTITYKVAGGGNIDGALTFLSDTYNQLIWFIVMNGAWYASG